MTDSHRDQLADLTHQIRGLAELDRLSGISLSPVPNLPPLVTPSPVAQVGRPLPTAEPAPVDVDPLSARRAQNDQALEALANRMAGCTQCRLHTGRTHLVFGQGDSASEVVFIGEGPGYHEDMQGLAFVGRAGELLTKMISAMGLSRDEVFIANVVKCRPPGNRNPQPDEMGTCSPFLREQLDIIKPRVICSMGRTAAIGLGLMGPDESLGRNRGRFKEWAGIPTMLTYHPAYLLRSPREKRKTWQDLQKMFPYIERRKR